MSRNSWMNLEHDRGIPCRGGCGAVRTLRQASEFAWTCSSCDEQTTDGTDGLDMRGLLQEAMHAGISEYIEYFEGLMFYVRRIADDDRWVVCDADGVQLTGKRLEQYGFLAPEPDDSRLLWR